MQPRLPYSHENRRGGLQHAVRPSSPGARRLRPGGARWDRLAGRRAGRAQQAEANEEERADGEETLQILRSKLGRTMRQVDVSSKPPGALVRLVSNKDDIAGVTPMSKWVPQGVYELTVTADGCTPHKRVVDLGAGEPLAVVVTLEAVETELRDGPAAAEPAATAEAKPEPEAAPDPPVAAVPEPSAEAEPEVAASGPGLLPRVVMGSGVALLAGGAAFGVMRNDAYDELEDIKANGGYWEEGNEHPDVSECLGEPDATFGAQDHAANCAGFTSIGWTGSYVILGFDFDIVGDADDGLADRVTVFEVPTCTPPDAAGMNPEYPDDVPPGQPVPPEASDIWDEVFDPARRNARVDPSHISVAVSSDAGSWIALEPNVLEGGMAEMMVRPWDGSEGGGRAAPSVASRRPGHALSPPASPGGRAASGRTGERPPGTNRCGEPPPSWPRSFRPPVWRWRSPPQRPPARSGAIPAACSRSC